MKLYDTLSGEKKTLDIPKRTPLRLFVCGPTVYDKAHLGHARTYIAFDALVRFLRAEKVKVSYLQNITDVDDRIIDRARREHTTPEKLARANETSYKRDMKRIGVTSVTKYARASAYIPKIVTQIKTLEARGNAYEIAGNGWYFDISTFPEYGKLSKRTVAQAEDAQTRIDENVAKRNRGDFTLWKFVNVPEKDRKTRLAGGAPRRKKFTLVDGEPAWRTNLGWGRPGWHIEDTAITDTEFGPQYDIHGGGEDLKFPHHEAEIAQEEASSGKSPLVNYWLHTGFIRVKGEKMSKSLGNFVTIETFLTTHTPEELRWLVLSHHYRSPINFDDAMVAANARSLDTLRELLEKFAFIARKGHKKSVDVPIAQFARETKEKVLAALRDDFNTPEAIAALFEYANLLKPRLWSLSQKEAKLAAIPVVEALGILGITLKPVKIPASIAKRAEERELYRRNKHFSQSDALRNKLSALGYSIDDTPLGPFVRRGLPER